MQPPVLKLLFVINPASGKKSKTDYESKIREYFSSLPHAVEIFTLSEKNNAAALTGIIKDIHPDRVVAVGGDGTVTMVAKQLMNSSVPMGIIPAGSANGMAKELDIPTDLEQSLEILINGQVKCCDIIKVNNQVCLHLSDIGLNAQLVKYFQQGSVRGFFGYARMVLKVLWRRKIMKVTIDNEDEQITREAVMVVLANASKYGTGAVINPEGSLYDGLFEVVVVRRLAISELFKMWFSPGRFNPEKIELFHTRNAVIETSHRVHFQVDGEYVGKVNKVKASIEPARINLVLPREEAS